MKEQRPDSQTCPEVIEFVSGRYVIEGFKQLDQKNLTPLLRLKYHDSLSDALVDLGNPHKTRTDPIFGVSQNFRTRGWGLTRRSRHSRFHLLVRRRQISHTNRDIHTGASHGNDE